MNNFTIYDLIIIGAGPAGLTSAIYAKRALLKIAIIEKSLGGGKLNNTEEINNYPGFESIRGIELAKKIIQQVKNYQIEWKKSEVIKIEKQKNQFILQTEEGKFFTSKAIIIASGTKENKLKIKGEEEFSNRGVSYCAICDGFLFRGKTVLIVGGGYSALEAALYMSNIAKKVYLIHRRDSFRAEKEIVQKAKNNTKIEILLDSFLTEIKGETEVEKAVIGNINDSKSLEIFVQAIFIYIGSNPSNNFAKHWEVFDKQNYILTKEDGSTALPGLFSAGDIAKSNQKKIKQIVTAIAEGAIAAQSAIKYLEKSTEDH